MKREAYTFFVASNRKGSFRKITLPGYVLHFVAILAVLGGATVLAAVGSYTRMLWKVGNYNTLRRQQDTLKHSYEQLQSSVKDTNERMNSLQSLATEVAMTYGFMRARKRPFGEDEPLQASTAAFQRSMAQFSVQVQDVERAGRRSHNCGSGQTAARAAPSCGRLFLDNGGLSFRR